MKVYGFKINVENQIKFKQLKIKLHLHIKSK